MVRLYGKKVLALIYEELNGPLFAPMQAPLLIKCSDYFMRIN